MRLLRDLLNREPLFGHALNAESPVGKYQIVRIHFQEMKDQLSRLLFNLLRRLIDGDAAHRGGPAAESADTFGYRSGVSMNDRDIVHLDAQLIGDDLRKGGLLSLPVRRRARQDPHFPGGFHLNLAVLPHSLGSHTSISRYPSIGADFGISSDRGATFHSRQF